MEFLKVFTSLESWTWVFQQASWKIKVKVFKEKLERASKVVSLT